MTYQRLAWLLWSLGRLAGQLRPAVDWWREFNDDCNRSGAFHSFGERSRPISPANIQTWPQDND